MASLSRSLYISLSHELEIFLGPRKWISIDKFPMRLAAEQYQGANQTGFRQDVPGRANRTTVSGTSILRDRITCCRNACLTQLHVDISNQQ